MRISGGGGASSHHASTHSNSHPSHSAVSHHEAPARSAPARSAPARRENPAPAHHSEPARDTVHISPQAARLERLMSSQDKITQSSSKPAPQPAKKESSGGFWSKLVDKVSNVAQKVEQTTKKVEQAVSKEAGHVEQAAKQVAHEAEQSTKAVLQEAKHVETKAANVLHQTAHEAEKVAQKAESTVSKNAHKIASKVEQEAKKTGRTLQKDAKEIASKVSKETEKIGHSAVTKLKNAEHTVSQGLKAAEQRERKIANGIAKDVQSVEQKVQSGAKHLEKRAIQAYQATQQAVGQAAKDVQYSVHQAGQEADKIGSDIEKGVRNLAKAIGESALASAGQFTQGAGDSALNNVTFGKMDHEPSNPTIAYKTGRILGDLLGIAGSVQVTVDGAAVAAAGGLLDATGVLIPVGGALNVAGAGVAGYGFAEGTKATMGLDDDMHSLFSKIGKDSNGKNVPKAEAGDAAEGTGKIDESQKATINDPFEENGKLKPDHSYKSGEFGYSYTTDSQRRISSFQTDNLQLTERENRLPHNPNTPGKQSSDHAGHIAADRFGGSPKLDNLVSQSSKVNQSAYRRIENQWATAIKNGKKVEVYVSLKYSGDNLRPVAFDIRYSIDGKSYRKTLEN